MLAERHLPSPFGPLRLFARGDALVGLYFPHHHPAPALEAVAAGDDHPILEQGARELAEYFAGQRRSFSVPTAPEGTPFQQEVWRALATIPFGETRSYADLAALVGRPKAVRAAGGANGKNPLAILIPCHRVIAADGGLGGYSGSLEVKAWLLGHEGAWPAQGALGLERGPGEARPARHGS